jgi:serine/threonine protein kinase
MQEDESPIANLAESQNQTLAKMPHATEFLKICFAKDPQARSTAHELLEHPFLLA